MFVILAGENVTILELICPGPSSVIFQELVVHVVNVFEVFGVCVGVGVVGFIVDCFREEWVVYELWEFAGGELRAQWECSGRGLSWSGRSRASRCGWGWGLCGLSSLSQDFLYLKIFLFLLTKVT